MERQNTPEKFEDFRLRIKALVDSEIPENMALAQTEFDVWYVRRAEEVRQPGCLDSETVKFLIEHVHMLITLNDPDQEKRDRIINDEAWEIAFWALEKQEERLRMIIESPDKYIQWQVELKNIVPPTSQEVQNQIITESRAKIESEIEALNKLIQKIREEW